jgi:SAM-dependent methyltransferase
LHLSPVCRPTPPMSKRDEGRTGPAIASTPPATDLFPAKDLFDEDWLRAREPVDHRSRDKTLVERLDRGWSGRREVVLVDLGCGTGSNARFVAPRLRTPARRQRWVFVDHDETLLAQVDAPPDAQQSRQIHADLDDFVSRMSSLGGRFDAITASALLDLVSESWLRRLVDVCRRHSIAALFALTYNGLVEWTPIGDDSTASSRLPTGSADDQYVRELVNQHQHRDKGLGAALGPAAGTIAEALFQDAGHRTILVATPWRLTAADTAVMEPLVDGWVEAAIDCAPAAAARIQQWALHRKSDLYEGRVTLTVGHVDLLALPGDAA